MAHQVLARKWRPKSLQELVGQDAIKRILSNALKDLRLHHAYLFTGTRGVGKTTIARIIAKCLNCETGISANPCQTCKHCQMIDQGQFIDLYEVDAASRTKVEDTRELLENVLYPPAIGKYKIYLIDEVHMLSTHSFNALLKTLEEPPAHAIFLLATTEPKKLPITILSRCLQFHLKQIPIELIKNHLEFICQQEKIEYEQNALQVIAKAAKGSMRDALSLLDQAIAYSLGSIKSKEVDEMLGSVAREEFIPLLKAIAQENAETLYHQLQKIVNQAPDFSQLLADLSELLYELARYPYTQQLSNEQLLELTTLLNQEDIQVLYQIALLGRRDLHLAPSMQQGFEMTLLRMFAFAPTNKSAAAQKNIVEKSPTTKKNATLTKPAASKTAAEKSNLTAKPNIIAAEELSTDSQPQNAQTWRELINELKLSGMAYALATNCALQNRTENEIHLQLSASHEPLLNKNLLQRITQAASEYFKKPMKVEIKVTQEELNTPSKILAKEQHTELSSSKEKIMQHPELKKIIETFDATVEVNLLSN